MAIAFHPFLRTVVITFQICLGIYLLFKAQERKSQYHKKTIMYFGLALLLSALVMVPDVLFKSLEIWFIPDTTFQVLFFSLLINRTFTHRTQIFRLNVHRIILFGWFTFVIFLKLAQFSQLYYITWYAGIVGIPTYIISLIGYTISQDTSYFDQKQQENPFFLNLTTLKLTGYGVSLSYLIPLVGFLAEPFLGESRFIIQDLGILVGISLVTGALIYDLTQRRKLIEQQQEALMNKIQESNEELKRFNTVVSHDLKAPLRSITNVVSWIQQDYGSRLDETGKEYLELLEENATRMHNFIDELLQYSQVGLQQEKMTPVNLDTLVDEVVESLMIPYNIDVIKNTTLPTITVNKFRITQVFQNLLSNAVKFIDKPRGEIVIDYKELDQFYRFSVKDNGIGISEQDQKRIFKLFYTLNPKDKESTGLGLSIVKKIVEIYDGEVWVESKVSLGSTFYFTLSKTVVESNS